MDINTPLVIATSQFRRLMPDKPTNDNQTGSPGPSSGVLLYLTSIGFAGAAIIIFFGIALVSLLSADNELPKGSGWYNGGAAVKLTHSDVFPTRGDAAPVPAETTLPSSAVVPTLLALPTQGAATDDRQPEGSWAQSASEARPLVAGASATKDASLNGTMPTTPISAEQRDQMFHAFETYQTKLGGNRLGPHETPAQDVRRQMKKEWDRSDTSP